MNSPLNSAGFEGEKVVGERHRGSKVGLLQTRGITLHTSSETGKKLLDILYITKPWKFSTPTPAVGLGGWSG
jgi:hypothetical protein